MARRFGLIPDREKILEFEKYYRIMGNKIKDELLRLDAISFSELESIKVQENIQKMTDEMNRYVFKWSRTAIPEVYREAAKIARVSLSVLGAVKNKFYDTKKHVQTVEGQRGLIINDFIKANSSIKNNVATYIYLLRQSAKGLMQLQAFDLRSEEVISGLLDDAIREGASRGKLNELIRIHFKRELYEKKFMIINGRNYSLIKYANMVSRTRMRIVQTEAVKNMCEQFDNDLIEISDHGTDCEICQEFEGNVYSINGNTPGYETIPDWPPYHPNCEHHSMPTSEVAIKWRETH